MFQYIGQPKLIPTIMILLSPQGTGYAIQIPTLMNMQILGYGKIQRALSYILVQCMICLMIPRLLIRQANGLLKTLKGFLEKLDFKTLPLAHTKEAIPYRDLPPRQTPPRIQRMQS